MGTVVFPDATLKIFLVADPVGARAAAADPAARPAARPMTRSPKRPIAIVQRDAKDATQTVQATDAVLIDTTYLTQEEQVERIVALAQRRNSPSGSD